MKAVIQRVKHSSVTVDGELISKINNGFMILLGVMEGDTEEDANKLVKKIPNLRIFEDDNGKIYIYYASSDTRLHVAESTVSQLVDYCLHTPTDGFRSIESVKRIITMVNHNKQYLKQ